MSESRITVTAKTSESRLTSYNMMLESGVTLSVIMAESSIQFSVSMSEQHRLLGNISCQYVQKQHRLYSNVLSVCLKAVKSYIFCFLSRRSRQQVQTRIAKGVTMVHSTSQHHMTTRSDGINAMRRQEYIILRRADALLFQTWCRDSLLSSQRVPENPSGHKQKKKFSPS